MSDAHLRANYERIRASNPESNLPPYEDLTDEQRENHRLSYQRYAAGMDKLAAAISSGGPLPSLDDLL